MNLGVGTYCESYHFMLKLMIFVVFVSYFIKGSQGMKITEKLKISIIGSNPTFHKSISHNAFQSFFFILKTYISCESLFLSLNFQIEIIIIENCTFCELRYTFCYLIY